MASSTVEDYLKRIYLEAQAAGGGGLVAMGKLAEAMEVTPGTATAMVKTLADSGLVDYEPRGGVRLTRGGKQLALHVVRRHRLVELFLVEVLGMDWSEVHAEAERLEHAVSDKVLESVDRVLGRPGVDPHGDPIPPAKGKLSSARLGSLRDCQTGRSAKVARVIDQDPEFLQFAEKRGLTPGAKVEVESYDPQADAVTVRVRGGDAVTLGTAAARKILVREG
jgi:DtxR family Mn-dependent transcriptional regulator